VEIVETIEADGSSKRVANKCDLCAGISDRPSCVKVCPTEALCLVTKDTMDESLVQKRKSAVAYQG
jgi:electron transport protein HydN